MTRNLACSPRWLATVCCALALGLSSSAWVKQPPVLSDVLVYDVGSTEAFFSWKTEKEATTQVCLGTTDGGPYEACFTAESWNGGTEHAAALVDQLEPSTTYFFRVFAWSKESDVAASEQGTFTTLPGAPQPIDHVAVSELTSTSAVITWTTLDGWSVNKVCYAAGTSPRTCVEDPSGWSTEHRVSLTGLTPGTDYTFTVYSHDRYMTDGVEAGPYALTTPAP